MQRRKFLIGMGSLAAGGAAAMGTGAVSQLTVDRDVEVAVVNDSQALLGLNISASSLENTEYASMKDGQLELHFDSSANMDGNGGQGLNPDSTNYFDNVFQIANQSKDDLRVDIDKSNLQHPDKIFFYLAYDNGSNIGLESWNNPSIPAGTANNVGVKIEAPDFTNTNWETGGNIVFSAVDESDQNQ